MQILITGYRAPDNPDPRILTCACGEHHSLEAETAQYICGGCGRVLGSQNALNAHRGRCSAKQNGHALIPEKILNG